MTLVTQYNLLQNGPPEESKLATYMVCLKLYIILILILPIHIHNKVITFFMFSH